jgi:hypothetical protein
MISLGCDAVYFIGIDNQSDATRLATILLKSGDALCFTSPTPELWHGVAKVAARTWPDAGLNIAMQSWDGPTWKQTLGNNNIVLSAT